MKTLIFFTVLAWVTGGSPQAGPSVQGKRDAQQINQNSQTGQNNLRPSSIASAEKNKAASDNPTNNNKNAVIDVTPVQPVTIKDRPLEVSTVKDGWDIALVIGTVGLVVVGGFGIVFAYKTVKEMRTTSHQTAKQMELEHRPWVSVTPVIVTPLTFDGNGVRVTVRFFIKNIGNSPALKTVIHPKIDLTWDRNVILNNWRSFCESDPKLKSLPKLVGMALFPGEHFQQDYTFTFAIRDIVVAADPQTQKFLSLTLMGCADYQFTFAEGHHQTRFLYDILRYTASSPFLQKIDVTMGTLPVKGENRVTLFRHIPSGSEAT